MSFRIGLSTLTEAVNMLVVDDDTRNWTPSAAGHSGSGGGAAGGGAGGEWSSQTPEGSAWQPSKEKTHGTPGRAVQQEGSRSGYFGRAMQGVRGRSSALLIELNRQVTRL